MAERQDSKEKEKMSHHKFPRSRTELLRQLQDWTADREELFREYERLQEFTAENVSGDTATAVDEKNRQKNRYKDILPYNWRTVKIPVEKPKPGEDHNKYINASWILFKGYKQKFIASQAPIEDTIGDFWHCIAYHQVNIVVMLTALTEGTKAKCARYWPETGRAIFSDTEVSLQSEEDSEHYTLRSLEVVHGEGSPREVLQIQVKGWGDYSVLESTATLLALINKVKEISGKSSAPVLVHCSAGVGRTGTYIATQRLMETIEQAAIFGRPCVWDAVVEMRSARPKMVQKKEQYVYIYSCLLDHMNAAYRPT